MHRSRAQLLLGLGLVVLILAFASLTVGKATVPLSAWLAGDADPRWRIIMILRAPRTILGILVGASLGLCGAAMQGYTRNPLADPALLGVSTMAALGAVISLYFGYAQVRPFGLEGAAIAGSILGVVLMAVLAGQRTTALVFLLAGLVLNTFASAGVSLALSLSPNSWSSQEILNWLMGSLADHSMDDVALAAPLILAGGALLLSLGRSLDALSLGEDGARLLGVNLSSARLRLVAGLGLASGAAVAAVGSVGFVGLIAPHLMRRLAGPLPSALLIPSALAGAALVLAADILVRLTPAGVELRLGVATALLGAPFFLFLLLSLRRRLA